MNEEVFKDVVDQCGIAHDIAQNHLAFYSDMSSARFSRGLSGESPFTDREQRQILAVIDAIAKLQASSQFPIAWSKVRQLKPLIDQQIKGVEQRPTAFDVILIGPQLFKRLNGDRIETTTSYADCAAFPISLPQNKRIANVVAKLLDPMTSTPVRVTSITNEFRSTESFSTKLTDVGFSE